MFLGVKSSGGKMPSNVKWEYKDVYCGAAPATANITFSNNVKAVFIGLVGSSREVYGIVQDGQLVKLGGTNPSVLRAIQGNVVTMGSDWPGGYYFYAMALTMDDVSELDIVTT